METIILMLGEHAIRADKIIAMRDAGDGKTSVWTAGQSAVDGAFLVDCDYETAFNLWIGEDEDGTQEETEEL